MLIIESLAAAMVNIGAVGKNHKNEQQHYKFRGIDDILNAVQPVFSEFGIVMLPEVLERDREERETKAGNTLIYTVIKVKFTFYAKDGSFVTATTYGEGMDSGDKSTNKAMSAACKYALLQVLCIPTEDQKDSEFDSPEESRPVPEEKRSVKPAAPIRNRSSFLREKLSWVKDEEVNPEDVKALILVRRANLHDTKEVFSGNRLDLYEKFVTAAATNNNNFSVSMPCVQRIIDELRASKDLTTWALITLGKMPNNENITLAEFLARPQAEVQKVA